MRILLFGCLILLAADARAQDARGIIQPKASTDTAIVSGTSYAVIIGVSEYKYLHPLKYADRDAYLFMDFLQSKAGGSLKDENVLLLVNDQARTDAAFRIEDWLRRKKFQKGAKFRFWPDECLFSIRPDQNLDLFNKVLFHGYRHNKSPQF